MGGKGGHVPPCPPEVGSLGGTWFPGGKRSTSEASSFIPGSKLRRMARKKNPEGSIPEIDPIMTTRSEALSEALRPGRHPNQARAYSTLIRRPERDLIDPRCAQCQRIAWLAIGHLSDHVVGENYTLEQSDMLAAARRLDAALSALVLPQE